MKITNITINKYKEESKHITQYNKNRLYTPKNCLSGIEMMVNYA